jgi:hypothetical protein
MYLRTTQRRNKDGSIVRYYALAENVRDPHKGHVEAKVVHSFGRADRLRSRDARAAGAQHPPGARCRRRRRSG